MNLTNLWLVFLTHCISLLMIQPAVATSELLNRCSDNWQISGTCIRKEDSIYFKDTATYEDDSCLQETPPHSNYFGRIIKQLETDTSVIIITSAIASVIDQYSSSFEIHMIIADTFEDICFVSGCAYSVLPSNNYVYRFSPAISKDKWIAFNYISLVQHEQDTSEGAGKIKFNYQWIVQDIRCYIEDMVNPDRLNANQDWLTQSQTLAPNSNFSLQDYGEVNQPTTHIYDVVPSNQQTTATENYPHTEGLLNMAQILFFPIVKAESIETYSESLFFKYEEMGVHGYSDPYPLAAPTTIGFQQLEDCCWSEQITSFKIGWNGQSHGSPIPKIIIFYDSSVGYNLQSVQSPVVDGISYLSGSIHIVQQETQSYELYFPTFLDTVTGVTAQVDYSYVFQGDYADQGVLIVDFENNKWTFDTHDDQSLQTSASYELITTVTIGGQVLSDSQITYTLQYTNLCQTTQLTVVPQEITHLIGVEASQTVSLFDVFSDSIGLAQGDPTYCESVLHIEITDAGILGAQIVTSSIVDTWNNSVNERQEYYIYLQGTIIVAGVFFDSVTASIKVNVVGCEIVSQTKFLPEPLTGEIIVQTRQNGIFFEVPTTIFSEECTSLSTKAFTVEPSQSWPLGVSDQSNTTHLYLQPQFGEQHEQFVIVWTESLNDIRTGKQLSNVQKIKVTFIDDCANQPIVVTDIQTMTTSVLRQPELTKPYEEFTDVSQTIYKPSTTTTAIISGLCYLREGCSEAYPIDQDFTNDQMCGDFTIKLYGSELVEQLELSNPFPYDFITFTEDEIAVTWTINIDPVDNKSQKMHHMTLIGSLDQYSDHTEPNTQLFDIEVHKCKVLRLDEDFAIVDEVQNIYDTTTKEIQFFPYEFFPLCEYETYWDVSINNSAQETVLDSQYAPLEFEWIEWVEGEGKLNIMPTDDKDLDLNASDDGRKNPDLDPQLISYYRIWTGYFIKDYPESYTTFIDDDDKEINIPALLSSPENIFKLTMNDPCKTTTLSTTFEQLELYAVIGGGDASYSFLNFPDTVSETIDQVQMWEHANVGYGACGKRIYQPSELGEEPKYLSIIHQDDETQINIRINSESINDRGSHIVELKGLIEREPYIQNQDIATLNVTFYWQKTDLAIEDYRYELQLQDFQIPIPQLEFEPGLDFGDQDMIQQEVLFKEESSYIVMPDDLAIFDSETSMLNVFSDSHQYIGYHKIKVQYNMLKYMAFQTFSQEFGLSIYPKPVEIVGLAIRPTFVIPVDPVTNESIRATNVTIGAGWEYTLPKTAHEEDLVVVYYKVDTGSAVLFVDYDKEALTLFIPEGLTTELNVGKYPIKMQLIDEVGVLSEKLTYTLNIVIPAEEDVQEEESSANFTETIETTKNDSATGQKYADLLRQRAERLKNLDLDPDEIPQPPKASKITIDDGGLLSISFSSDLEVLPELLELTSEGFSKRRNLQQGIASPITVNFVGGDSDDVQHLESSWSVSSFESRSLSIQIAFTQPLAVSASKERDKIIVVFNSEDYFFDKYLQPVPSGTTVETDIPPQFADAATKEAINNAASVVNGATSGVVAANIVVNNLFMTAGMQYLWDMINAQQIVVLLPLFDCVMPANAGAIFSTLMQIASFDAIPTDDLYQWLFKNAEFGEAISSNFETVGIESIYVLNNLGSLGLVMLLYPLIFCIYYLMGYFRCSKFVNRQQKRLGKNLFWGAVLRLIMESYMIGFLCCAVNLKHMNFDDTSKWSIGNIALTFLLTVLFISFPILSYRHLSKNFLKLKQKSFDSTYGELYHGLNIERQSILRFMLLDYFRRIILGIAVVFYSNEIWLHFMLMTFSSVALIIMAGMVNPHKQRSEKLMERFNEAKLVVIMYHIICFTDYVPDAETKFFIGYSCITFVIGGLLINSYSLITSPFFTLRKKLRLYCYKRSALKLRKLNQFGSKDFNQRRIRKFKQEQQELTDLFQAMVLQRQEQKEAYIFAQREALDAMPRYAPNAIRDHIDLQKYPERPNGIDMLKAKVEYERECERQLESNIEQLVQTEVREQQKSRHRRIQSRDHLLLESPRTPRYENSQAQQMDSDGLSEVAREIREREFGMKSKPSVRQPLTLDDLEYMQRELGLGQEAFELLQSQCDFNFDIENYVDDVEYENEDDDDDVEDFDDIKDVNIVEDDADGEDDFYQNSLNESPRIEAENDCNSQSYSKSNSQTSSSWESQDQDSEEEQKVVQISERSVVTEENVDMGDKSVITVIEDPYQDINEERKKQTMETMQVKSVHQNAKGLNQMGSLNYFDESNDTQDDEDLTQDQFLPFVTFENLPHTEHDEVATRDQKIQFNNPPANPQKLLGYQESKVSAAVDMFNQDVQIPNSEKSTSIELGCVTKQVVVFQTAKEDPNSFYQK